MITHVLPDQIDQKVRLWKRSLQSDIDTLPEMVRPEAQQMLDKLAQQVIVEEGLKGLPEIRAYPAGTPEQVGFVRALEKQARQMRDAEEMLEGTMLITEKRHPKEVHEQLVAFAEKARATFHQNIVKYVMGDVAGRYYPN